MGITNQKWDGSASQYPDTPSYCDASLINLNTGDRADWTQANCKLPIKEPNGDINTNALPAAAAALNGGRGGLKGVSPAAKKKAAKALVRAYNMAKMDVPPDLKNMAM